MAKYYVYGSNDLRKRGKKRNWVGLGKFKTKTQAKKTIKKSTAVYNPVYKIVKSK